MSAALSLQKSIRARLVAKTAITDIVPAASILDRHQTPAPDPSIIMGEAQTLDEGDDLKRRSFRVYSTLHIWMKERSLAGTNELCGLIVDAVLNGRFPERDGWHCVDQMVSNTRLMRDPDGETSHGVVTVEALMRRAS
ncbi:DUF3168 domain-containing protein [Ahrensia sp. 13_GOM-1096m]|uniref:DUF3168 domain-containing protein n=1 Tax=Ahrensia sp. 13_GOM-1096m TaxID=1380380 RepID=UPI00047D6A69|nr:DUF3168 domain-containing protein [Ahrensia sp. 13_GOM-1096m]